jgi:hypothetical protein
MEDFIVSIVLKHFTLLKIKSKGAAMKKYQFNVDCYQIYSNEPISILALLPVVEKAKRLRNFGKVFTFQKTKYIVEVTKK